MAKQFPVGFPVCYETPSLKPMKLIKSEEFHSKDSVMMFSVAMWSVHKKFTAPAPSPSLLVLFFSGYQHTPALGETKKQTSLQKKEEKRSNPHHICPT